MRTRFLFLAFFAITTLLLSNISAHTTSYNDLPCFRLVVTETCLDTLGIAFLGEAGDKVYRGNGTVGMYITQNQRIKIGGEYLVEKLKYNFVGGHDRLWAKQYAVGGQYEYLFDSCCFLGEYINNVEIGGYYSHAQSFDFDDFLTTRSRISRHLAGGQSYDVSLGSTFTPWCGATFYLATTYDSVRYDRKFHHEKHIHGFGEEFALTQRVWDEVDFTIRGEFKRPYNLVGGIINWRNAFWIPHVGLGIFADYTHGKDRLPTTTLFGVQLSYDFGYGCTSCYADSCCSPSGYNDNDCLRDWVRDPAVYVPIVLAIPEDNNCIGPTAFAIPTLTVPGGGAGAIVTGTLDLSRFFLANGGGPLTFNAVSANPAVVTVTIDPNTGLLTYNALAVVAPTPVNITVSATNACGTISQILTIINRNF